MGGQPNLRMVTLVDTVSDVQKLKLILLIDGLFPRNP